MQRVNRALVARVGVNCRHITADNTEFVIQDFGNRGQAVRRAGSVGNNFVFRGQLVVVNAVNNRQIGAFGRSGNQNAFGAGFQMDFRFVGVRETARAFIHDIDVHFFPGQFCRVGFGQNFYCFAVNRDGIICRGNFAGERTVNGIELQQMSVGFRRTEVVDRNDVNICTAGFCQSAESQTTDTAKSINRNANCHVFSP